MTIDKNLVLSKIKLIQDDLSQLKKASSWTIEEITSDYIKHKAVERMLEVIINEAIDINQHLIVEEGQGNLPFNYRDSFVRLADFGVLDKIFAQDISRSVGLRNILVHQYRELDEKLFFQSISDCLKDYKKYIDEVLKYLKA